jgi:hypothetical protein
MRILEQRAPYNEHGDLGEDVSEAERRIGAQVEAMQPAPRA